MQASDSDALHAAIQDLFTEYLCNPLYYLREAGLQARLAQLIHARLMESGRHETSTVVKDVDNRRFKHPSSPGLMARTQLEVRVQTPDREQGETLPKREVLAKSAAKSAEKSDIVILRQSSSAEDPILLTNYPNGPLDIVRLIRGCDIDAVIEVKATVSADPHMRHLFRCDVFKLLDLQDRLPLRAPSMHFVMIDKSLAIGGHEHLAADKEGKVRGQPTQWWDEKPQPSKNMKSHDWSRSNDAICVVRGKNAVFAGSPAVHVWQLSPNIGAQGSLGLACERFVATRC